MRKQGEKTKLAPLECAFCGKTQREVRKLIAGPHVYICDECIKLCNAIIWTEIERGLPSVLTQAALDSLVGAAKRVVHWTEQLKPGGALPPDEGRADGVPLLVSALDSLFEALIDARLPWPAVAWKQRAMEESEARKP